MLALLPPIRHDEIVPYSPMARYNSYFQYPKHTDLIKVFFNSPRSNTSILWTNNIGNMLVNFPLNHNWSLEKIIHQHTLYRYITAFLDEESKRRIWEYYISPPNVKIIPPQMYQYSSFSLTPSHLRFCPECVQEDKNQYSESPWRRLFQTPGVLVCPKHDVFLENSSVIYPARKSSKSIQTLNIDQEFKSISLDLRNRTHFLLKTIALEIVDILEYGLPLPSRGSMKSQYQWAINQLGRLLSRKWDNRNRFGRDFTDLLHFLYPSDLLQQFLPQLSLDFGRIRTTFNGTAKYRHPLYHILFIVGMGYSVRDFMTETNNHDLIRRADFPCMNYFCRNFKRSVIDHYQVGQIISTNDKMLLIFSCECGFSYGLYPGKFTGDFSQYDYIHNLGPIWNDGFVKLFSESDLSIEQLANLLQMPYHELVFAAHNLGLYPVQQIQKIQQFTRNWENEIANQGDGGDLDA